ncbi:MAG: hypothetical protein Fur0046_26650 [Cyanobacteria bacterium J069]
MSFSSRDSIRVQKVVDRQGHTRWQVRNTVTHEASTLGSEAEVMDWIENSYNHTTRSARNFWFFM